MLDASYTTVDLTEVYVPELPGVVNIRAGGTYCVLVKVTLGPEAEEYLINLATPLLAAAERSTYGTTDLQLFGLAVAERLRRANDALAREILTALEGHDPKTWFTGSPSRKATAT
jgi:hypothetical protein